MRSQLIIACVLFVFLNIVINSLLVFPQRNSIVSGDPNCQRVKPQWIRYPLSTPKPPIQEAQRRGAESGKQSHGVCVKAW